MKKVISVMTLACSFMAVSACNRDPVGDATMLPGTFGIIVDEEKKQVHLHDRDRDVTYDFQENTMIVRSSEGDILQRKDASGPNLTRNEAVLAVYSESLLCGKMNRAADDAQWKRSNSVEYKPGCANGTPQTRIVRKITQPDI